ncbi:S-adenosyl-L-methionine-dependent methyltransferase [Xylariomycetidae sp. FL0641]|nr:S-adenosyl-L-methionine-dependent methyltransferase [Xylariomycetidae sp. FL0641]
MEKPKPKRKKAPQANPIETAITSWLEADQPNQDAQLSGEELLAQAPKRWTVYEPMALLPTGSFTSAAWARLLPQAGAARARDLWRRILAELSRRTRAELTHLAVNEGIPLRHRDPASMSEGEQQQQQEQEEENILRSPTGLRMLYGTFFSGRGSSEGGGGGGGGDIAATDDDDYDAALWVRTRQNGIAQTWAPARTMFSRGNVKEKARLLAFHSSPSPSPSPSPDPMAHHRRRSPAGLRGRLAVDLYAGIGYFAFSYAARGLRVLAWELNGWSVEGLRRGARANGWTVRVVRDGPGRPSSSMADVLAGPEQIVVFHEDNARAAARLREVFGKGEEGKEEEEEGEGEEGKEEILHVNAGLLPSSRGSWADAWDIATLRRRRQDQAWLHLHENVGVADIERRRTEIEAWFAALPDQRGRCARVEHVELVKTYAPGVWHCVFDLYITKSSGVT